MATKEGAKEIRIPYITQSGQPLHQAAAGLRRAYMQNLSGEQQTEVLQASAALGQHLHGMAAERATTKRDSVKYASIPVSMGPKERAARMAFIADLFEYFQAMGKYIETMKATEFLITEEGFVSPLYPPSPQKPEFPG